MNNASSNPSRTRSIKLVAVGVLIIVALITGYLSYTLLANKTEWAGAMAINIAANFLGAVVIFALITEWVGKNDEATKSNQNLLLTRLNSSDVTVANKALNQIRSYSWHKQGVFNGRSFNGISIAVAPFSESEIMNTVFENCSFVEGTFARGNIIDVSFNNVHLDGVNFWKCKMNSVVFKGNDTSMLKANISHVESDELDFSNIELQGVNFSESILRRAKFCDATCTHALFFMARLTDADFSDATLYGVDFKEADLTGAKFNRIKFDETTTLPDGTKLQKEEDFIRFTDPNHPHYWRSSITGAPTQS